MSEEKENVEVKEEKVGTVEENAKDEPKDNEPQKGKNGLAIGIIVAIVAIALIVGGIFANKNGLFNNNIVGKYDLVEMSEEDSQYSEEDIEALKALGLNVSLELRSDGTGTIDLFGETMDLTYDNKNMTIDEQSTPYAVDGNRISLEQAGNKLVFEKIAE